MARKAKKKNISSGVAHIHSSNQNTIITFTDEKGNVIAWSSSGKVGFKGTKKKTPFAASEAAKDAAQMAKEHGISQVRVEMKGLGSGKDSARKQIEVWGIKVTEIKDVTPIPHNGTRPPKRVLKRLRLKK
ncbi:30S ribosomal protein S11 [Mycoplasmopsis synoviae]|uniref:Small ribosomal subunit protein uS11 n=1 Tax=Mycoplasmopsis synoviae TaxID=2109 RepID=A0AAQ0EJU3_MYCSY|nr:30S ribosomal protein S11 [Mycoplasmopsis synoviae]AKB11297.1 30S ribosomal protein S11 [Mycoplasmopsis synoviae ATCC 25204]AKJ20799.1 SSU ribosomal protein S11p (S14e) [Mycoplasmopsis synoviae]AQU48122.1 SSU ribosomal protein S11p (S14e) [Mycoplasmopsis synoviae]AWL84347.1 30S ribosomal protein S11 [Mycoplasmopsis synoviae]MBD5788427.1 30S ribosomal protein S11 [Mycoplasmopsis synoviae GX11-T]